jgi:hypothetical protein
MTEVDRDEQLAVYSEVAMDRTPLLKQARARSQWYSRTRAATIDGGVISTVDGSLDGEVDIAGQGHEARLLLDDGKLTCEDCC